MGFIAAVCPSCGANIQLPEGASRCFCTFCGNQVIFEDAIAKKMEIEGTVATRAADFDVQAGCLLAYHGASTDVVLPDTVRTFGDYAFKNQRITSITLPRVIDWMAYDQFRGIPTLRALNYEYEGSGWRSYDGVLYSLKDRELIIYPAAYPAKDYTIVEGTRKVTITGNPYLKKLSVGVGIEEIVLKNLNGLEEIVFGMSPETLPAITISDCPALKTVEVSTTAVSSFTMEKCKAIESLALPGFVQNLNLSNCSALTRVDCPSALDSLWIGTCPITFFNREDCIYLPNGAGTVHIEHVSASNLHIAKHVDRLNTWGDWKTVTFDEGVEKLDHIRFNKATHIILPRSLKEVGEDFNVSSGTTYEFPGFDHADIRCAPLKYWRSQQWEKQGRCPKCGGNYVGLFKKHCENCGYEKPKN